MMQCFLSFLSGFFLGFVVALSLIIGVALIPVVLGLILAILLYAYYKYRREQKRREEILRQIYGELGND